MASELLTLGSHGSSLRAAISPITPRRPPVGDEEPAFDAVYEVDAHPFGGTLRDALVLSDLTAWRNAVSQVQANGTQARWQSLCRTTAARRQGQRWPLGGRGSAAPQRRRSMAGDSLPRLGVDTFGDQALAAVATVLREL
jgi:hypothetical protein